MVQPTSGLVLWDVTTSPSFASFTGGYSHLATSWHRIFFIKRHLQLTYIISILQYYYN